MKSPNRFEGEYREKSREDKNQVEPNMHFQSLQSGCTQSYHSLVHRSLIGFDGSNDFIRHLPSILDRPQDGIVMSLELRIKLLTDVVARTLALRGFLNRS